MDKVFFAVLGLLIWFSYMDSQQILSFFIINTEQGWNLYNTYTGPAIWLTWYVVLAVIGLIWYIIFKDKSEALAITASAAALIWFGTQDLFYFLFSEQTLSAVGCWADGMVPVKIVSTMLGETCPTATSFILSGFLGVIVAYYLYNKLKESKW